MIFGEQGRPGAVDIRMLEQTKPHLYPKHFGDELVNRRLLYITVLDKGWQMIVKSVADHFHVYAGAQCGTRGIFVVAAITVHDHFADGFPVTDNKSTKSPVLAEYISQQMRI